MSKEAVKWDQLYSILECPHLLREWGGKVFEQRFWSRVERGDGLESYYRRKEAA